MREGELASTVLGTPILFLATADPVRARAFYEDTLGLRLLADEPFALVFDAGGTMLRIQRVEKVIVAPYTVLGWSVANLRQVMATLRSRGIAFNRYDGLRQDDLGIWVSPSGAKVAWFHDPDGNVLSLTEKVNAP
jgi:catechol 2,3-dioxygenase-like lactoylglutathione lyase family enzyme